MPIKTAALELSGLDRPVWYVHVEDEIYGPYSERQMLDFVDDGRVTPDSRVSAGEGGELVRADELSLFRRSFGLDEDEVAAKGFAANFLISAKLAPASRELFLSELDTAGVFSEVFRDTFLVRSRMSVVDLRISLERAIAPSEQLIIVDATRNRLAWSNCGVETDAMIRGIWNTEI